jgi:hypothetical protein
MIRHSKPSKKIVMPSKIGTIQIPYIENVRYKQLHG